MNEILECWIIWYMPSFWQQDRLDKMKYSISARPIATLWLINVLVIVLGHRWSSLVHGGELYNGLDSQTVPYGCVKSLSLLNFGLFGNEAKVEYHQMYYFIFIGELWSFSAKPTHKTWTRAQYNWPLNSPLSHQTHSLSQRRAVPGRRKRFDTLLAEHKNRTRERERERDPHPPHSQQNPSLRDPHPSSHLAAAHDAHQVALGNGPATDATKPLPVSKPKFHSPGLPRYVLLQMFFFFFSFWMYVCVMWVFYD